MIPGNNPTEENHRTYRTAMTKKTLQIPQTASFLISNAHVENVAESKKSIGSARKPRERELIKIRR